MIIHFKPTLLIVQMGRLFPFIFSTYLLIPVIIISYIM